MTKLSFFLACIFLIKVSATAQSGDKATEKSKAFTGAQATKPMYHVIYQLDNNDPKIIEKAMHNINNALNDTRLVGKIEIEVIAFGDGTEAYMHGSKFESDLKALSDKGVILSQCNNTLKARKINRDQLFDFISVVPSGNGELIIRQGEGWAVIKP